MPLPRKQPTEFSIWHKAENNRLRELLGEPEWKPLGGPKSIIVEADCTAPRAYLADGRRCETLAEAMELAHEISANTGRPLSGPSFI